MVRWCIGDCDFPLPSKITITPPSFSIFRALAMTSPISLSPVCRCCLHLGNFFKCASKYFQCLVSFLWLYMDLARTALYLCPSRYMHTCIGASAPTKSTTHIPIAVGWLMLLTSYWRPTGSYFYCVYIINIWRLRLSGLTVFR